MVISTAGITSQAWKIVSQIRVLKKLSSCSVLHLYYYLGRVDPKILLEVIGVLCSCEREPGESPSLGPESLTEQARYYTYFTVDSTNWYPGTWYVFMTDMLCTACT